MPFAGVEYFCHGQTTIIAVRRVRTATLSAVSVWQCCASSLVTATAGAPAPRYSANWLGVGGRSWHVAPRVSTEGERPLAGVALSHRAWVDDNYIQRGTARAHSKLECCASSLVTATAGVLRRA